MMSPGSMRSGAAASAELRCKNGHEVNKYKKLRPWQGHAKDRSCNGCGQPIDRKEFRWRCPHHCDWDLCGPCYDRHWSNVLHKAAKARDPGMRAELLQVVPPERRPKFDDQAQMPLFSPTLTPAVRDEPNSVLQQPASKATMLGVLSVLWVVATLGVSAGSTRLLSGPNPLFPDPWLLTGVTRIGAALICKLAALMSQYSPDTDQESVDTTSAAVLGGMFGIECGLYTKVLTSALAESRHEVYLLRPAIMAVAGVLAGTDAFENKLGLAAGLAIFGGALSASGGVSWPGLFGALPFILLAGAVTIFRWVFALNVLPRHGGLPPLWYFSGQMMWPAGLAGFEIAFLTNYGSYRELLRLAEPITVVFYLLIIAACAGAQLMLELRIVQASSLSVLGFCMPMVNVVSLLLSALIWGKFSFLNLVGIASYAGGVALFSGFFDKVATTNADYLRLEDPRPQEAPPSQQRRMQPHMPQPAGKHLPPWRHNPQETAPLPMRSGGSQSAHGRRVPMPRSAGRE